MRLCCYIDLLQRTRSKYWVNTKHFFFRHTYDEFVLEILLILQFLWEISMTFSYFYANYPEKNASKWCQFICDNSSKSISIYYAKKKNCLRKFVEFYFLTNYQKISNDFHFMAAVQVKKKIPNEKLLFSSTFCESFIIL